MPKRKMTEEEWDELDKATDQDKMFEFLPILIKDNYEFTKDGHIKEINLKFEYKKVRADHLLDYCLKMDGLLVRCYQESTAREIGKILEDAVHLILYRLNCIKEQPPLEEKDLKDIPVLNPPPHQYRFTRHHEKDIEEADFISDSIVIECKNWANYKITDSYVDNQILPRFENYSDSRYRKILLTSASFSPSLENKILQNKIKIFRFSRQITHKNFQKILNELLPLIANDILNLDMKNLPDVSYIPLDNK